jgi:hypothetical protein
MHVSTVSCSPSQASALTYAIFVVVETPDLKFLPRFSAFYHPTNKHTTDVKVGTNQGVIWFGVQYDLALKLHFVEKG